MFAHRLVHAVKFDEMKRPETSTRGTVLLTIRGLNVQAINLAHVKLIRRFFRSKRKVAFCDTMFLLCQYGPNACANFFFRFRAAQIRMDAIETAV